MVLKAKNISPSQLADDLGVQRSGISHIINGRNKPSLEFVQKLIKLYPDISTQWILFGEGPMMNPYPAAPQVHGSDRPAETMAEIKPKPRVMELFNTLDEPVELQPSQEEEKEVLNHSEPLVAKGKADELQTSENGIGKITGTENATLLSTTPLISSLMDTPNASQAVEPVPEVKKHETPGKPVRKISKILVFYNDRTFVEYNPGDE